MPGAGRSPGRSWSASGSCAWANHRMIELWLPRQNETQALVVEHHAVAPDALDLGPFLQYRTFMILAHIDIHEALGRLGRVDMHVEVQFGQRLRTGQVQFTDRRQYLLVLGRIAGLAQQRVRAMRRRRRLMA